jgi:tripartite-type tricarboxylate transporter receptor subunit TctC
MPLRSQWRFVACLIALACAAPAAFAADDDYPKRQIKIIVPFPGGAGPDQVARLLGKHLQDALGQPVVIENRAGALGSIGAAEVPIARPTATRC